MSKTQETVENQEPQKNAAQEDEDVQRKRLLLQNGRFKAISTWFTKFSKEIEAGTAEQCEVPLKNLLKEMLLMEYWSTKMDAMKAANLRDQISYAQNRAEQDGAIVQAQCDIEQRKSELEGARVVRQHNEEYERLRSEVMQHQQRAATAQECEQLEADILQLQAESDKLSGVADVRRKQLALLMHCLDDLVAPVAAGDDTDIGGTDDDGPVAMDDDGG